MLRLTCFVLLSTLVVGIELQAKLNSQWKLFKSTHGKKYSGDEEKKRQEIFKKNVEDILKHNLDADMGLSSYTEGINEFSDLSHEEFKQQMLGGEDISISMQSSPNISLFVPDLHANLPKSVDWRQKGIVNRVKNQATCGSCWAFSAIAAVESSWAKKTGKLISLSEQQLVDCASNNRYGNTGCDGGTAPQGMMYIMENGISSENCYPYAFKDEKQSCVYKSSCKAASIKTFNRVPPYDEEAMKNAVSTLGPVSVAVDGSTFRHYKSGIFNPRNCNGRLTHAVVVIGYGTEGGMDYWLVKNSYGTTWGTGGYGKIARNAHNMCGIASYAFYPIV